jgi:DivIVA domain-containing protein
MTSEIPAAPEGKEAATHARRFPRSRVGAAERGRMHEAVREVDFPIALRGYDRAAVDRYVEHVNRLIAELELSSSPESAVRRALEEVSEETSGLLQRAYETAEEITARSRAKADERLQQAEREAEAAREAAARETDELRETARRETSELRDAAAREAHELRESAGREVQEARLTAQREVEEMRMAAEARVSELDRNAEAIWRERRRLIEDMRIVAQQQLEIADAAAARIPRVDTAAEQSSPVGEAATEEDLGAVGESTAAAPEGPGQA